MAFYLSKGSIKRLKGVNETLVQVVHRAIEITEVDFGVSCGLRTIEEQRKLYSTGASKTLKSKHIDGEAVDLVAYMNGNVSWELSVYDEIATAVALAARELDLPIRWGAAWHIPDIRYWEKSFEEAYTDYIDLRRAEGRVPFIDAPHFEINR
jgi:peptidoglycan L-alanyl-D-glutamate endopeptidase CwlK